MDRRTLVRIFGGAAAAPILAGCTVLDALDEDRFRVEITGDNNLMPGGITIAVGDTVVWRNESTSRHRLSCDPDEFDDDVPVRYPDGATPFTSNDMLGNERFTHTFDVAGEYVYACTIHPEMIGTITVQ